VRSSVGQLRAPGQAGGASADRGTTVLSFMIDSGGKTSNVSVLKALEGGIDQETVDDVKAWRYRPTIYKGEAFPLQVTVELEFGRCKAPRSFEGSFQ
jgi:TonB family protein